MSNRNIMNALQGKQPVTTKPEWQRPVLDILELQSAEHGIGHTQDRRITQLSG
jgi:hypothetical protein